MESLKNESIASSVVAWLLFGGKLVGGIIFSLAAVLYFNQEKILYMPNPPGAPRTPDENPHGYRSPADWTLSGHQRREDHEGIPFEDVMLKTADGVAIHAWLLLQPEAPHTAPTTIYFHGNAGNMGFRLPNAARIYATAKTNILMVDYRGYGKSEGTPSEKGLQLDAEAALDFVTSHTKLQGSSVVAFGRSLGGAVAIFLAKKFPTRVQGIAVENTFLSVSAMVDVLMPFLVPIKPYVLNMHWRSDESIADLKQPMLFISGDRDELIPTQQMITLHKLARSSSYREFYSVKGGTHNDTWMKGGAAYYVKFDDFLDRFRICTAPHEAPDKDLDTDEALRNPPPVDEDFFMVDASEHVHIPTMKSDFSVK